MRLENDDNFNFLYNEEFAKIPFLFRFSRKRCTVAMIIMFVSFAAGLVLTSFFYASGESMRFNTVRGYESLPITVYNNNYMLAAVICFAITVLFSGWMVIAKLFEKRAFAKATQLNNMIFLSERHKLEVDWQNWKMNNRF